MCAATLIIFMMLYSKKGISPFDFFTLVAQLVFSSHLVFAVALQSSYT